MRPLSFVLLISVAIFGCNSNPAPTTTKQTVQDSAAAVTTVKDSTGMLEIVRLNEALKKFETPPQHLIASGKVSSQVTGDKGTIVRINPGDLETESGQPLKGDIDVELKELTTTSDFVLSNAQTVSGGSMLISGGAYYINITAGGQQLRLKAGKSLKVQFPRLSDAEMGLFYGQRDSVGQMNWRPAQKKFVYNTASDTSKTTRNTQSKPAPPDSPYYRRNGGKMDAATFKKMNSVNELMGAGPAHRSSKQDTAQRRIINSAMKNVYDEMSLQKLGWINVDKFVTGMPLTNLVFNFGDNTVKGARLFLVFNDINSVLETSYAASWHNNMFSNVPIGARATLIALSFADGKFYSCRLNVKIEKDRDVTLNMRPTSEKDIALLMKMK